MEVKKVKTRVIYQEDLSMEELKAMLYDEYEQQPESIPSMVRKAIFWHGKHFNCQWTKSDHSMIIRLSPLKENDPYLHVLHKDIGPRLYNALVKRGIKQLSETQNLSKSELKKDKNVGSRYTKLLEQSMNQYGFSLLP